MLLVSIALELLYAAIVDSLRLKTQNRGFIYLNSSMPLILKSVLQ